VRKNSGLFGRGDPPAENALITLEAARLQGRLAAS